MRGAGCQLHAAGHGWERYVTASALLAFTKVASTFFNFDFRTRFSAPFTSIYDVCPYDNQICISWQSNIHTVSGVSASQAFDFAYMSAGCGNVHFYPNAITQYTFAGDVQVLTFCENYGLHNTTNGKDLTTPYQSAMAIQDDKNMGADTRNVLYDCSGAENAYLFASMPGYANMATASDGTAMHNWWVYNFY